MGAQLRHFRSLSRKNWINWKRTLAGSITELLCPVMMMMVLAVFRMQIPRETLNNIDLAKLRHGLYPMAQWDDRNQNYTMSLDNIVTQSDRLSKFMINGNITTDARGQEYIAMLDGKGPLMFFPPHCVDIPEVKIWASPIVAYIKSESEVQDHLIKQLEAFYDNQEGMWNLIKSNDMLYQYVAEARKALVKKSKEQEQAEAEEKANLANQNMIAGVQRDPSSTFFPNIKFRLQEFESKDALDEYIKDPGHGVDPDKPGICFGLTVHEHGYHDYELELFFNDIFVLQYKSMPTQANLAVSSYQMQPQVREYAYYSYYGFAYLQNWAANTILRHVTNDQTAQITAMTVPMKIPPMLKDPFAFLLGMVAPYVFIMMYIPMIYRTTYRIVQEKEHRLRETMRIMGMNDTPYWLSWMLYHSAISFIMSVEVMLVAGFGIFSFSDVTCVWLMFFLYGQAIFGLILTIQALFSDARTAAIMMVLMYFGTSAMNAGGEKTTLFNNCLLSLMPTTCMTAMLKVLLGFEQNGLSVQWSNIDMDYKKYSMLTGYIMLIVSFLFWSGLGLYLENVMPRQYGKRRSPCFCLDRFRSNKDEQEESGRPKSKITPNESPRRMSSMASITDVNKDFECMYMRKDAYEGVTPEVSKQEYISQILKIEDLTKTYDNGFQAVKGINLKLYPDQIFVLLGHNGAGKTSTISLLTGLYEPTTGEAEIFGVNMFQDFEQVRKFMGICPQHDVLFELLTPQEHMEIFYDFKCEDPDPVKKEQEITKLLVDVGVDDKKDDLSGQLSGGNQRKLSVAIALCGGSRFVIFDEPTAGMDLSARRQTWTMLKEYKRDRIILLTTHYMDEADILGDRIGIMAAGKLVCLGSSMFLKRRYGVGYNMTMIKANRQVNELVLPYFWEKLGKEVKKMSEIQSEVTLQIPKEYASKFKTFFKNFDQDLYSLQILAYGVSITTLEDVFMKVGHMDNEKDAENESLQRSESHYGRQMSQSDQFLSEAKYNASRQFSNAKSQINNTQTKLLAKHTYPVSVGGGWSGSELCSEQMEGGEDEERKVGRNQTGQWTNASFSASNSEQQQPINFNPDQQFTRVSDRQGYSTRPEEQAHIVSAAQFLHQRAIDTPPDSSRRMTADKKLGTLKRRAGNFLSSPSPQIKNNSSYKKRREMTIEQINQANMTRPLHMQTNTQIEITSDEESDSEDDNESLDSSMQTIPAQIQPSIYNDEKKKGKKTITKRREERYVSKQVQRPQQKLRKMHKLDISYQTPEAPFFNQKPSPVIMPFHKSHTQLPGWVRPPEEKVKQERNTSIQMDKTISARNKNHNSYPTEVSPSVDRRRRSSRAQLKEPVMTQGFITPALELVKVPSTTNTPEEVEFNLSESPTDDSFSNSFKAVTYKRYLLYKNSKKYIFFDIFLPAIFMILGVVVTNMADTFERSESRILAPDRVPYPEQLIIMDSEVKTSGSMRAVKELASLMPQQEEYFDFAFTDRGLNFTQFEEYVYNYGQEQAPQMPYFYSGYQFYEVDPRKNQYKFYNFLNMTNQDAGGLYPQFMYEAILKMATKDRDFKFKTRNTPYPRTQDIQDRKRGTDAALVAIMASVAYSTMMATICGAMVEERVTRQKHIQVISGVQLGAYWAANFFVDVLKMEFVSITTVILFRAYETVYVEGGWVFICFPLAAVPLCYVAAFIFPSVASAQTFMISTQITLTLLTPSLLIFLRFMTPTFGIAEFGNVIMKLNPGYCLGHCIYFHAIHDQLEEFRTAPNFKGWELSGSPWHYKNISGDLAGLAINFVVWILVLAMIEQGLGRKIKEGIMSCNMGRFPNPKQSLDIDNDVTDEANRVAKTQDKDLQIKVTNLRKVYLRGSGPCNPGLPLCAVENLSFGLKKGECFALLGVNGAGKSTTFKILTAEEEATSGSIKIQGMDMNKEFQKCRKLIGYCPQYNPIFDTLSVEENIEYFARIKGIPQNYRQKLIENVIEQLGLDIHRTKAAGTLSGGNKRKLSVAIAIVGNPPIILLDEPSAGMDPEARRFMWEVVGKIAAKKTSAVILTSHLMEEAEALSSKMGIMVKGGIFKCFGSSQHIKNKFGVGFEVEVKIKVPSRKQLLNMTMTELHPFCVDEPEFHSTKRLKIGATLRSLASQRGLSQLESDLIRKELVVHFKQAQEKVENIEFFEGDQYEYVPGIDSVCSAHIFMEKLNTTRNLFGTIKAIVESFGSLEQLEQYGNYMRLRVSSDDKTIGQMFGMIDELKKQYHIDQYSISQTTLEQIFQSFANLNFDQQVKQFVLNEEGFLVENKIITK